MHIRIQHKTANPKVFFVFFPTISGLRVLGRFLKKGLFLSPWLADSVLIEASSSRGERAANCWTGRTHWGRGSVETFEWLVQVKKKKPKNRRVACKYWTIGLFDRFPPGRAAAGGRALPWKLIHQVALKWGHVTFAYRSDAKDNNGRWWQFNWSIKRTTWPVLISRIKFRPHLHINFLL